MDDEALSGRPLERICFNFLQEKTEESCVVLGTGQTRSGPAWDRAVERPLYVRRKLPSSGAKSCQQKAPGEPAERSGRGPHGTERPRVRKRPPQAEEEPRRRAEERPERRLPADAVRQPHPPAPDPLRGAARERPPATPDPPRAAPRQKQKPVQQRVPRHAAPAPLGRERQSGPRTPLS